MKSENYKAVYLGVDIVPTAELIAKQKEVCTRFGLIPRKEFHITIAYLGNPDSAKLSRLIAELPKDLSELLVAISPSGFGVAIEKDGVSHLESDEDIILSSQLPIVAWLSLENNAAFLSFRNRMTAIGIGLGFEARYLQPNYSPHITIGSNGPKDGKYWGAWDAHRVKKVKTIGTIESPKVLVPQKVHITNAMTHPNSLILLQRGTI